MCLNDKSYLESPSHVEKAGGLICNYELQKEKSMHQKVFKWPNPNFSLS